MFFGAREHVPSFIALLIKFLLERPISETAINLYIATTWEKWRPHSCGCICYCSGPPRRAMRRINTCLFSQEIWLNIDILRICCLCFVMTLVYVGVSISQNFPYYDSIIQAGTSLAGCIWRGWRRVPGGAAQFVKFFLRSQISFPGMQWLSPGYLPCLKYNLKTCRSIVSCHTHNYCNSSEFSTF